MSELGPLPVDEQCPIPTLDLRDAIRKEHGLLTLEQEERYYRLTAKAKEQVGGAQYGVTAVEAAATLSALAQASAGASAWKVNDRRASTRSTEQRTDPSIGAACKWWMVAAVCLFIVWWLSWTLHGSAAAGTLFALLFIAASVAVAYTMVPPDGF